MSRAHAPTGCPVGRRPRRALLHGVGLVCALLACAADARSEVEREAGSECAHEVVEEERFAQARARMVREQLAAGGIGDPRVLEAMRCVPRHELVPAEVREQAYADTPLPIGSGQTISQPYMVAFMTEALELEADDRVLDVGTGSGYQAAVLAEIVAQVDSIEIVPELARRARHDLARLGYRNVTVRQGDGYAGWPEHAPFDAIVVAAAPDHVPQPLVEQLAVGGRLVMPVGEGLQQLVRLTKTEEGVRREELMAVRFVPMTGEAEER